MDELLRDAVNAVQRMTVGCGRLADAQSVPLPQRPLGDAVETRLLRMIQHASDGSNKAADQASPATTHTDLLPLFPAPIAADHVHILLDTSSSMVDMLDAVRQHVLELSTFLTRTGIRVTVTAFSDTPRTFDGRGLSSDATFLSQLEQWLAQQPADGLTCTREALEVALQSGADAIVLITDGLPTSPPSHIIRMCAQAIDSPQGPWMIAPVYLHDDLSGIAGAGFGHSPFASSTSPSSSSMSRLTRSLHSTHLSGNTWAQPWSSHSSLSSQPPATYNPSSSLYSSRTPNTAVHGPAMSRSGPLAHGSSSGGGDGGGGMASKMMGAPPQSLPLPPSCDADAVAFLNRIGACCNLPCFVTAFSSLTQSMREQEGQQSRYMGAGGGYGLGRAGQNVRTTVRALGQLPQVQALIEGRATAETQEELEAEVAADGDDDEDGDEDGGDDGKRSGDDDDDDDDDDDGNRMECEQRAAVGAVDAHEESVNEEGDDAHDRMLNGDGVVTVRIVDVDDDGDGDGGNGSASSVAVHTPPRRNRRRQGSGSGSGGGGDLEADEEQEAVEDVSGDGEGSAHAGAHDSALNGGGFHAHHQHHTAAAAVRGGGVTGGVAGGVELERIVGLRVVCLHDDEFRAGRVVGAMRPEGAAESIARVQLDSSNNADNDDGGDVDGDDDHDHDGAAVTQVLVNLNDLIPYTHAGPRALYALTKQGSIFIPSIILQRTASTIGCKLYSGERIHVPPAHVVGITLDQFANCVSALVHSASTGSLTDDNEQDDNNLEDELRRKHFQRHAGSTISSSSDDDDNVGVVSSSPASRLSRRSRHHPFASRHRQRTRRQPTRRLHSPVSAATSSRYGSRPRSAATSTSSQRRHDGDGVLNYRHQHRHARYRDRSPPAATIRGPDSRAPPTRDELMLMEERDRHERLAPQRRQRTMQRISQQQQHTVAEEEGARTRARMRSSAREQRERRAWERQKEDRRQVEYSERKCRQERRKRQEKLQEIQDNRAEQETMRLEQRRQEVLQRSVDAVMRQVEAEEKDRIRISRRRQEAEARHHHHRQIASHTVARQQIVDEAAQARTRRRLEQEENTRQAHVARANLRQSTRQARELTRRVELSERREWEAMTAANHGVIDVQRRDKGALVASIAQGDSLTETLGYGRSVEDEEETKRHTRRLQQMERQQRVEARRQEDEAKKSMTLRARQRQNAERQARLEAQRAAHADRKAAQHQTKQAQARARHDALHTLRENEARRQEAREQKVAQRNEEKKIIHQGTVQGYRTLEARALAAARRTHARREHHANMRAQRQRQEAADARAAKQTQRARHFAGRAHEGFLVLPTDERILP
ncbi:hypothetical protein PTSG_05635 [Salpingoeca rosetta]|uniref:VWFA domain-containing protein n=1 Tax=Salpingoeca rosetta (strain ATCC 50818 / BSB-021) TaxID=946362 RepID=F2UBS4_SALR5|nr:uncharacterized protein PTSG_05635 [Salpingoeca rosetta]EGD73940.1 hypothetical protein PTSG_05635 [Salpingoeca rosetta]|eukprot:XP_004993503.1 hypothetical protein PTSG_05635 [Salpingoeca rosetta]